MSWVTLDQAPVLDVRPLLVEERAELLRLLQGLSSEEWERATAAPGWSVKDVALHLLDDDLGWLSRGRDGDPSGRLAMEDHAGFADALAAKNQRWIDGARGLSLRVVAELLEWTGRQMDAYYDSMDLHGEGRVSWAGDGPVPLWFDIAQDLTERWVHQMQMREAVGRVEGYAQRYLPTVLRTFVWALPHQFRVESPIGTTVQIDLASGGVWTLTCEGDARWNLHEGVAAGPAATATFDDAAGWRWLTGAPVPASGVKLAGRPALLEPLQGIRGIVA